MVRVQDGLIDRFVSKTVKYSESSVQAANGGINVKKKNIYAFHYRSNFGKSTKEFAVKIVSASHVDLLIFQRVHQCRRNGEVYARTLQGF